uniref:Uncharacterized protein n=1 Tax=Arundo donax TaxID=35708 RepID=A0A0A8XPZ7_ARUDO
MTMVILEMRNFTLILEMLIILVQRMETGRPIQVLHKKHATLEWYKTAKYLHTDGYGKQMIHEIYFHKQMRLKRGNVKLTESSSQGKQLVRLILV